MENQQLVREHYGADSLGARVEEALARAKLGEGMLAWSDLVPLDQFHVRGLTATKELAEALNVESDSNVLDVGSGLGGPARFLAATYGCQVTGIDLSQPFVDIATMLTDRSGLKDRVTFRRADALNLPFAEASFAHAWTQHVAMNIAARKRFYEEIHRVVEPGGRFAFYDVIAGDGRDLEFPVPWASRPEMSFLLTSDAMREVLDKTGFAEVSWADTTEAGLNWFAEARRELAAKPALGIAVVMGPEFPTMAENLTRNLKEGRVRLVQAVFERA